MFRILLILLLSVSFLFSCAKDKSKREGPTVMLGGKAIEGGCRKFDFYCKRTGRILDTSNPEAISRSSMVGMILLSLTIAIIVFIVGPAILTSYLERLISSHLIVNVIEGILRLGMFIAYIAAISQMEDIKRVFMYHGAEHMTVHAKEHGDPLQISHIRRYPTAHPRCGTAFLLTLMLIAIIVFTFVGREPIWWLLTSRVILIPVIAAVSYEIIRFSGRYKNNLIVSSIALPSLWLQALTTRSPKDDQIEVAIAAMEEVIKHEA